MKQQSPVVLALAVAAFVGLFSQPLAAQADAQILGLSVGTAEPAATAVTTNVAASGFFSASSGDEAFVGASYLVFGGGTDAIDVITINTAQFNGAMLDGLSITYDIPYGVTAGVSGTVAFGTYTNKTYNNNSTYNSYVLPNTYLSTGNFSLLTGTDSRNGSSDITLSGFASAANIDIAASQDLEIVFEADAAPFQSLAPNGDYFTKNNAIVNAVEEPLGVPEPSTNAGLLGGLAGLGAWLQKRRWKQQTRTLNRLTTTS